MVTFLFGGVPVGDPIEWRPGLQFINPLAGPVILPGGGPPGLPSAGSGLGAGRGGATHALLLATVLAACGAFALAGAWLFRRR